MHELSIALSIVEGASEEASRHNGHRVEAVHLKLGQLSGVVKEALLFSYGLACEGTRLEGSRLEIEDIPATVFCTRCDAEQVAGFDPAFLLPGMRHCNAGSPRGRELLITGLELSE